MCLQGLVRAGSAVGGDGAQHPSILLVHLHAADQHVLGDLVAQIGGQIGGGGQAAGHLLVVVGQRLDHGLGGFGLAVVVGDLHFKGKNTPKVEAKLTSSQVFVKQNGRWLFASNMSAEPVPLDTSVRLKEHP